MEWCWKFLYHSKRASFSLSAYHILVVVSILVLFFATLIPIINGGEGTDKESQVKAVCALYLCILIRFSLHYTLFTL